MRMFSPEIETMPRVKIREMQLERLKHIVRYAYENVKRSKTSKRYLIPRRTTFATIIRSNCSPCR